MLCTLPGIWSLMLNTLYVEFGSWLRRLRKMRPQMEIW